LAEVVQRHLDDLRREAARLGVTREKLFTHVGGWKGELFYQTAVNPFSCPAEFINRRRPRKDVGVQTAQTQ
jgi:hypothetical protein